MELKIIEELGFSIGEDACLLDDDDESKMSHPDNNLDHEVPNTCVHIVELVINLADDWEAEEKARHSNSVPFVQPKWKEMGPQMDDHTFDESGGSLQVDGDVQLTQEDEVVCNSKKDIGGCTTIIPEGSCSNQMPQLPVDVNLMRTFI